ncbi:uncharacterized protein LOC107622362 [Arachis ipaensis]|uniref:uncharacterized protein LOC107622362 n=1 Tax=Arachis ipaensis TaxID=130454 RepID=UPI0007AFC594|nr:uncharacterized protein LOC107622362 [Arachis ipaensis]
MLKLNTHMNIEQSSCRCWYYIIRRSTKKILHTWKMISFFFSLVGWLYDHNNGEDLSFTCQWFRLLMEIHYWLNQSKIYDLRFLCVLSSGFSELVTPTEMFLYGYKSNTSWLGIQ